MVLAARGARDLDGGIEGIEDPGERAQVRRQALRVHLQAWALAGLLTLLALSL